MAVTPQVSTGKRRKLDSWKAIADYLDRDVRSVQRWEHVRGLPVYRVPGAKSGGVFAYTDELDEWLHRGRSESGPESSPADVSGVEPSSIPETPGNGPIDPSERQIAKTSRTQYRIIAVIAAVIVLGAGVALMVRQRWKQSTKPHNERVMLAVLPFLNLSGDPAQEYFADGLTEEMITDLGKLNPPALGVIARTSAMKYKDTKEDIAQIGHDLGVKYVLEGSVRREGNMTRISAQLIQVSDQTHLWAQNYERDVKDILSVQRDVAQAIADKIQIKLSPQRQTELAEPRPTNPQAYDDYLKGLYLLNQRSVASMTKAVNFFQQAADGDPNYADAYAGMAQCYGLLSMEGTPDSRDLLAKSKASAQRAVELDDTSSEAHVALGGAKVFSDYDWTGAEAEFKRALELNPNNALAHHWYANLYLDPQGRYEDAIAEMKRAQELDPLSLIINTDLGYAYLVAGSDDAALKQFQQVLEMDSSFAPARYDLTMLDLTRKRSNASLSERISYLRNSGVPSFAILMENLYLNQKQSGTGREQPASQAPPGLQSNIKLVWGTAQAYAYLDDKQRAITLLEAAYEMRTPAIIYIKCDPFWSTLRGEARCQQLERKVGLSP